eukprot:GHVP01001774.1.p1 GENE.GHVP01001774.1~~GHVP01001774.1.p1  ORF type:complete len:291 (-),score=2.97 GHVP01001774.1:317-1189(-)
MNISSWFSKQTASAVAITGLNNTQFPISKQERAKTRQVVSGNDSQYIQMAYLAQGVEEWLSKGIETTLGPTAFKRLRGLSGFSDADEVDSLCQRAPINDLWGVPIDQSSCDHQPLLPEVLSLVKLICTRFSTGIDTQLRPRVESCLIQSLKNGVIVLPDETQIPVKSGILSGWRWTAVLVTMWVAAAFLGIQNDTGISVEHAVFQGDDEGTWLRSHSDCVKLVEYFTRLYTVNQHVYQDNERFGFLSRAIPSIVSSLPWQGGLSTPSSIVDNWSLLYRRGLYHEHRTAQN